MNRKLMTAIVSIGMLCMSFTSIYAAPMELVYDGIVQKYDLEPITLYINGEVVDTSLMPPIQLESTTLVPVREVFEPMGAFVEWKAEEKKVYINYNNTLLILEMNNKEVWLNGETATLDMPAKVINDKIMVPVRFISEQMGFHVQWIGETREIYITGEATNPEVPPEIVDPEEPSVPEEPSIPEEDSVDEKVDISDLILQLEGTQYIYEGYKNKHSDYVSYKANSSANILSADVVQNGTTAVGVIQADGAITDINSFVEDGKIVVDITNSKSKLSSSITPTSNKYVSGIRTSQFAADTTRVVFDLKAGAKTKITLSSDRKTVFVDMEYQPLEAMIVGADSKGDYLVLDNISKSQIKMEENLDEIRLVIDNISLKEDIQWNNVGGDYIEQIIAKNTSTGIDIRISLNTNDVYVTQVQTTKGDTTIRLLKPSFKNIGYSESNKTITLNAPNGLSAYAMTVTDLYREKKIIVDLGANYEDHFGSGQFNIGDQTISTVEIVNDQTTKLVINEKSIHAVNIRQTNDGVQIQLVKPREKYQKILVIDPGHGGSDSGASGNGIKEKDINLKQALAIKNLIEANTDIKVYMTRENDTTLTLAFRTDLSNDIEADMFVSVHNNSGSSSVTGTEVLYYPNSSDLRGKQIAQLVQNKLIQYCGTVNRGIKERPDLYVLRTSKMPAILIEGGFISNASEAAQLNSSSFTAQYARAVYEAIVESFNTLTFR